MAIEWGPHTKAAADKLAAAIKAYNIDGKHSASSQVVNSALII